MIIVNIACFHPNLDPKVPNTGMKVDCCTSVMGIVDKHSPHLIVNNQDLEPVES